MIPLHDDNPTELTPVVTVALIVACAAVFLWQASLPPGADEAAVRAYGMTPAVLFGQARLPAPLAVVAPAATVLTSMFLHGGWMHLIGNMLYLWIFGNNIEDAMGHVRFVVFYLMCGTVAALAQGLAEPDSTVPMIGASGAVSGVLGAYLVLYPRAHVVVLIFAGVFTRTARLPALIVLGFWFVLQFFNVFLSAGGTGGGVAYWAHVGGFIAGTILIFPFRRHRSGFGGGGDGSGPWGRRR
jgi:membrane associated rhomboid family serine protease